MKSINKNLVFCICSKNPSNILIKNISNIKSLYTDSEINVIDSDSNNFEVYNIIKEKFPDVKLHFIKNKNYEIGAWRYALNNINAEKYILIQDTLIITKQINFDFNKSDVYTFKHKMSGGFFNIESPNWEEELKIMTEDTVFADICQELKYRTIDIATHSSFAITKKNLELFFSEYNKNSTKKCHSEITERLFYIMFKHYNFKISHLIEDNHWYKIHSGRK